MSSIQTKPMKDRSTRPLQSQNGNSDPQNINKNQPTGEQLRIAQITSSDRSDVDPEMMKKIKEVSDLTGRSADEAWTALHDCNGDANQAVELLFEKEGEQDEWQEKKKRKKPTVVTTRTPDTATTSSDTRQERTTTTDGDIDRSENIPRGQQRDRAPPRFQRGRGRGFNHSGANGEKDASASRERGPDRRFEGGRGGARRGGRGGGGVGGRGGEGGGAGRSRGGRAYNSSGTGLETVPHIDTWTNETAQNGRSDNTSIGAWGDTATEEWTADEWSGSLEESLVLTRSMPTPRSGAFSAAAAASSSDASQLHPQQHQQQTLQSQVFVPSSHAAAAADALNDGMTTGGGGYLAANHPPIGEHGANRSVGFDLNHLLPKFSEQPYSAMTCDDESAAYLSHYTKKATECIKNAVGIGSSNLGGHGVASSSGGVDQMGRPNATQSSGAQQMPMTNRAKQQQQHHHQQQQQQQQQMPQQHHQQQQQRPRLPPPSKIPSSAVEMPGSMGGAQLDVQFGNWDSSSAAAASSSAADVSVFLNDSAQTMSQFAGQNIKGVQQQSSAMSIGGGGGKVLSGVGEMSSLHKTSGAISINDPSSSSSVVLSIHQEINSASKPTSASSSASSSTSYQTNASAAAQPNDQLGNSNKMTNPQQQQQQQLSSFPTSVDDRKTIPFTSQQQQPSNQLPGGPAGSIGSSQLGLSQLAYSSGVESAPSVYKPSPAPPPPSSSSAYSQPSSAVSGPTPYGSTLHYPTTGPQTMHPTQYQVAPSTQGVYSPYGVNDQSGFGNAAPASYGAMSTQVPTGFGGAGSKPYGSVAEKPSGQFPASVLSQVYESNAYPTGSQQPGAGMQMGYQSTGAMYQGPGQGGAPAVGLSYEGLPGVASNAVYQNPANLYRQMPSNDFQSDGYPPRGGAQQGVASTAPQGASAPGKLGEGLSKMSVKDSAIISQQSYDSSSVASTSSLTSAAASASAANASSSTGLVVSSAPSSSLKTMTPATSKATAASNKTAMGNWPQSAVPAPMMNVNPNYMISQPPGFQLATFGYPTAQQTMPYPYEDLQILQQRYALQPAAYYDLPLQASSALPGRDLQASLTSASYVPGSDVKLAALMDQQQPQVSVAQPPQQQGQSAGAGQQQQSYPAAAAAAAAMHPGYSYYYPPAAGMVPYYTPMIPVGGMAVPMVTNPTHGATTSSTQYQKPTLYGSHAFGTGGQSQQDFSKTFNPQASSVKATGTATGVAPSDMIVAGNAFGKSHVQGFDKVGFHSGTPPPTSYGLALASGTQGGALGQPAAIYGAPYLPMMSHQQQQTHSQLMQHAMAAQDSSMAGRAGAPQNAMQAKVGSSKTYANPYWAGGN